MKYIICLLIGLIGLDVAFSQEMRENSKPSIFHYDAVVFRGKTYDSARVDIYTMLPYQTLEFRASSSKYYCKYNILINISDSANNKYYSNNIERVIVEEDYSVCQGSTGKFDFNQAIAKLPPGTYKVSVSILDQQSKAELSQSRTMTVINYNEYNFSTSGIMLVSSIEEKNGKYSITPHVSDNIGILKDYFFAFFETYNNTGIEKEAEYVYEILDGQKLVYSSKPIKKILKSGTNQDFLRIDKASIKTTGSYILKIYLLNRTADSVEYTKSDVLAIVERSIKSSPNGSNEGIDDIDKAISQLRYVARQKDLDYIKEAASDEEKRNRFHAFWVELDPSPGTLTNEAMEQYYERVAYANNNFRSYTAGWLTDKGMVYIVYGRPTQIESSISNYDNRSYERWIYPNNREFIFIDSNGFGDWRLYSPQVVNEKYKYIEGM